MMQKIWQNIKNRWFFYAVDALIVGLFVYFHWTSGAYSIRNLRLAESYGLLAAVFLYLAVMASAIGKLWNGYIAKRFSEYEKTFFTCSILLAGFHIYFAFFKSLGGFAGLSFLSTDYYRAFVLGLITFAFIALFLRVKVLTSSNIYLVLLRASLVVLIYIHALFIGSHFKNFSKPIPITATILLYALLLLYSAVITKYFTKNRQVAFVFLAIFLTASTSSFLTTRFERLISNSMQGHSMSVTPVQSARYTVSLFPSFFEVGKKTKIELSIFNAATGDVVRDYDVVHEKLVHLVIVDENLNWYSHIHPEWDGGKFVVEEALPQNGAYRAYASFAPKGESEQVNAFRLVAGKEAPKSIVMLVDDMMEKNIEDYKVKLKTKNLSSSAIASGGGYLDFTLKDSAGKEVISLYPYLGAFGHLVMISTTNYSYIHVHPLKNPVIPDDTAGPTVEFMVMGEVPPGVYKVFGQFAPNKKVITVPFTVEVK